MIMNKRMYVLTTLHMTLYSFSKIPLEPSFSIISAAIPLCLILFSAATRVDHVGFPVFSNTLSSFCSHASTISSVRSETINKYLVNECTEVQNPRLTEFPIFVGKRPRKASGELTSAGRVPRPEMCTRARPLPAF